jgi:PmbA protein
MLLNSVVAQACHCGAAWRAIHAGGQAYAFNQQRNQFNPRVTVGKPPHACHGKRSGMAKFENAGPLLDAAGRMVEAAMKAGATGADAVAAQSRSIGVSIRNGAVESSQNAESSGISFRVFVGRRVASVSADADADPQKLAERAVAMASVSPEDPSQGFADPSLLARDELDLDLYDGFEPSAGQIKAMALEAEDAMRAVGGVTNSGGASAGYGLSGVVLVTSHGFTGAYQRSGYSISASAIAGQGTGMERDYDYSSRIHFADLGRPAEIGRNAGERAVRRIGARRPATGRTSIVFDPRVARSIAGHLAGAINGLAVARKMSFLRDAMGTAILPDGLRVTDNPLVPRRAASRPFDGEGVRGEALEIVADGVLNHWLLSSSAARELGLTTNGRGARSGASVSPTSSNFAFEPGAMTPQDLISSVGNGIYVTELIGQGVNMVTGQYSRGASGFLIENGVLGAPVGEFTIADELPAMFKRLVLANDVDRNYATAAPTLAIDAMMVGGADAPA